MAIVTSAILQEIILPFLLVFVLVFAVLQKTKIFGEGKKQIDALVSLAIGLILIAFPMPRDIIVNLMPWLAVGLVVLLTFMLLYGFVGGNVGTGSKWMKIVFGILAGIFLIVLLWNITPLGDKISGFFSGNSSDVWGNIIIIVVIVAAFAVAVSTKGNSPGTTPRTGG